MPVQWEGPVVVTGKTGIPDYAEGKFQDITLGDLRIAVDYFVAHSQMMDSSIGITKSMGTMFGTAKKKSAEGVRANCNGDRLVNHRPKYEEVTLPHDHPIHKVKSTLLSQLLDLPILIWKYPPDKAWKNMNVIPGQSRYYNEPHGNWAALFMNVNTDIMSDRWRMPALYWQTEVGGVLIIRQDGKASTLNSTFR